MSSDRVFNGSIVWLTYEELPMNFFLLDLHIWSLSVVNALHIYLKSASEYT